MNPKTTWARMLGPILSITLAACGPAWLPSQPATVTPLMPAPSSAISRSQSGAAESPHPSVIASLHPTDGAQVCPRLQIGVDLLLTDATRKDGAFDPSTVNLFLDGEDVTAAAVIRTNLTSPVSRAYITYTPPADLPLGQHQARITFSTASGTGTATWTFTVAAISCD